MQEVADPTDAKTTRAYRDVVSGESPRFAVRPIGIRPIEEVLALIEMGRHDARPCVRQGALLWKSHEKVPRIRGPYIRGRKPYSGSPRIDLSVRGDRIGFGHSTAQRMTDTLSRQRSTLGVLCPRSYNKQRKAL